MPIDVRQQILGLPGAMREMLREGRPEYSKQIRQVRWGEAPIYIITPGPYEPVGEFGVLAFEGLLEWPAIACTPADFEASILPLVRPRTIVMFVSEGRDCPQGVDLMRAVKARGGIALALLASPEDPLVKAADGAFLVQSGEGGTAGIRLAICMEFALGFVALLAAQALKRNRPEFASLDEEFARLPDHIEWVSTQLMEAIKPLAAELSAASDHLTLVGGGCYYPTAKHAAAIFRPIPRLRGVAVNATGFLPSSDAQPKHDETLLVLSGSRCRVKKSVHAVVEAARQAGAKILSVTDANDPVLSRRSTVSVLLPQLSEIAGAILTHTVMAWVAYSAERLGKRRP